MAKIIISRKGEWMNRLRSIYVYINDKRVGNIKNDSSEEFVVEPGAHKIQCKIDRCACEPMTITIKENEVKVLKLKSGMKYYWLVASIAIPLLLIFFVPNSFTSFSEYIPMILSSFILLYLTYFLTVGKNRYLSLTEDSKGIFSS